MSARNEIQVIEQVPVRAVHGDVSQEIIQVTVDRLRLVLRDHSERLARSRDWATPLGVLVTIILTFVTADFHDRFSLKAAVWQAVFLISGALTFVWLLKCLAARVRPPSVDDLIDHLKDAKQKE